MFAPYENVDKFFSELDGTSRLNQMGQNFTVVDITTLDFGHYMCDATSEDDAKETLELGQLFIREGLRFFESLWHCLIHIGCGFLSLQIRR